MLAKQVAELTDGELRVMSSLWELKRASRERLAKAHGLPDFDRDFEAVLAKGLIRTEGTTTRPMYTAAVTEEAGQRAVVRRIADRVFGGSLERLMLTVFRGRRPTADERAAIERHLGKMD